MPHGEHDLARAFEELWNEQGVETPPGLKEAMAQGLVKAVEYATERATAQIAASNRRRLILTTTVVTALVVAAIAIPVTYILSNESIAQSRAVARRDTLANCMTNARARPQGNARAFDQVVILDFLQAAVTPKKPITQEQARQLEAKERAKGLRIFLAEQNRKLRYWRQFTVIKDDEGRVIGNELPEKLSEYGQLEKVVQPAPLIDCRTLIAR